MNIYVLLPAYNESQNLPELLKSFSSDLSSELYQTLRFIIVDDGSTDNTKDVILDTIKGNKQIEYLEHQTNQGLSKALKTGIEFFLSKSDVNDYLIIMDADNTHLPSQISAMYDKLKNSNFDIAIASRYQPGSVIQGVSSFRKFLSKASSLVLCLAIRVPNVRDYSCGYRMYKREIVDKIFSSQDVAYLFNLKSFACMTELLLLSYRLESRIIEIPMFLKYNQKRGASKINIAVTILESFKLIWNHYRLFHLKS